MKAWLILPLLMLVPAFTVAGEIRGAVMHAGQSVGPGINIDVHCGEKAYTTTTDKYGSYRLFIPESGSCRLQVRFHNQTPSRDIVSFEGSTRYDLTLDKEADQYLLRRK